MQLDGNICYRAIQTRDARFDGQFFTAVKSTGIYCRPICPAPTPQRRNCTFYPSAAAAHEAGFRPCLRCRPEVAPEVPAWSGTSATVTRAMRLISEGLLDKADVAGLAERLGIGDRHLRRLFLEHVGATPVAVAQTRRILFAKKLLTETKLPIVDVAFASGFSSLRRFNSAMLSVYDRPPRELRRNTIDEVRGPLTLKLAYRPPFHWDALIEFLRARAIPGVEVVTRESYRRSVRTGVIEVRHSPEENCLLASIALSNLDGLRILVERVRRLFDLHSNTDEIAACLRRDPLLSGLVDRYPGLRLPGAWNPFELAVRAILGQQISVAAATTLAGRIVERWGEPLPDSDLKIFPSPHTLASADLASIGLPRQRAEALGRLAKEVATGALDLDSRPAVEHLCELQGVGEWTAQYICMRAFGEPDAFPASDLGLRRAAGNIPAAELLRRAENWRPWRAYAAIHLWTGLQGSHNGTTL
jgi:AraC family transcriptional regulator of adaptative response / DNA-3-methyladenine glycosylase II